MDINERAKLTDSSEYKSSSRLTIGVPVVKWNQNTTR